jgi:hypothetical protein
MKIDKRQCIFQNEGNQFGPGLKDSPVNCMRNDSIEKSILKCGCRLWFTENHDSVPICDLVGAVCFTKYLKEDEENILKTCPSSCNFVKYSSSLAGQKPVSQVTTKGNTALRRYFINDVSSVVAQGWTAINIDQYLDKRRTYVAIVHLNFEDPEATVVTMDAKVTFADMLGTVGGTFGIFLGVSFIGLVESFIYVYHTFLSLILKSK